MSHHSATSSVSQRSKDRRQVIADKKNNKKMSALQDLKARREEKKKQGEEVLYLVCFVACSMKSYAVFQGVILDDHAWFSVIAIIVLLQLIKLWY